MCTENVRWLIVSSEAAFNKGENRRNGKAFTAVLFLLLFTVMIDCSVRDEKALQ